MQDCRLALARFALRGIPALPAGWCAYSRDVPRRCRRSFSVTAMEKSTGVEDSSIQVKPSYGLTDSENRLDDQRLNELCRAGRKSPNAGRTKSRSGACAGKSSHGALAADAALLSAAERQVIDDAAASPE